MYFRNYDNQPHADVNLNEQAMLWDREHPLINTMYRKLLGRSPHLTPSICQRMIDDFHRSVGAVWSSGGYLEDRSYIWKGGYMEAEGKHIHLGVDVNVPAGTEIWYDQDVRVLHQDDDRDPEGGWGPRLFLELPETDKEYVLILAHLQQHTRNLVNETIKAGDAIAQVGTPKVNGGWYSHIHLQPTLRKHFDELKSKDLLLKKLDGYSTQKDLEIARILHPEPSRILRLDTAHRIALEPHKSPCSPINPSLDFLGHSPSY